MLSSLNNHRHSLILQALFSALLVSLLPLPAASELANATRSRGLLTSCNLFHGKWLPDPSYPLYQSSGCPFIDPEFDCIKYGRPDKQFLKFSWKPDSCNIPRYHPSFFDVFGTHFKSLFVMKSGLMGWTFSRDGVGRRSCLWETH